MSNALIKQIKGLTRDHANRLPRKMDRPAFPKPCVITIGMTKGGSCKTWWALNLATTLGMNGYRVVVVDLNPQHDLTADSQILLEQGIYPRFDAFSHDITDENGNINPMPDISPYLDYDFIIYDTPQFLNYPVIRFAWQNCHLMLAPFTPDCADLKNYIAAVRQYRAMPGERGPIACIPSRVSKMKNNLALEALNDCLSLMEDLGCDVPEYPQSYMIDYNPSLALQNTRWIYNKMTFRGADRAVTQKFLDNVHLNLGWILMVLQKYYGPYPLRRCQIFHETIPMKSGPVSQRNFARDFKALLKQYEPQAD